MTIEAKWWPLESTQVFKEIQPSDLVFDHSDLVFYSYLNLRANILVFGKVSLRLKQNCVL